MSAPYKLGQGKAIRETPAAILFDLERSGERWVPKSQIHDDSEVWKLGQSPGAVVVNRWFAEKTDWA